MSIRRVSTVPGLGEPVGAFSQAVIANGLVYTSGQIPVTAHGTVPAAFEEQLRSTLENLKTLLIACGARLNTVIKVNGYLTNPQHLDTYNRIYLEYFGAHLPARTTVCVSLWGIALEIDCVAVVETDAA